MSKRRRLKDRVLELRARGKSTREISDEIGCRQEYARKAIYRAGLPVIRKPNTPSSIAT